MTKAGQAVVAAARRLREKVDGLRFVKPVACVYNPLAYAWRPHEAYLRKWGNSAKRIIFLGMNPGPWGMAQTGVPFGEIAAVRDWIGVCEPVGKPDDEHPARPIEGFGCRRSEVSGARLWGLFRERFGDPEVFFRDHFVANYCPLVFMEASGKNLTPDKLNAAEAGPLGEACDRHLSDLVRALEPAWVIGIGAFAEARAIAVREAEGLNFQVGRLPHPSPANPAANRGWMPMAEAAMVSLGLWRPRGREAE